MAVNRKRILELYDYGEGLSIRQLSELLGNSRNTVRKTIQQAGDLGITKEVLETKDRSGIDAIFLQASKTDSGHEPLDCEYLSQRTRLTGRQSQTPLGGILSGMREQENHPVPVQPILCTL